MTNIVVNAAVADTIVADTGRRHVGIAPVAVRASAWRDLAAGTPVAGVKQVVDATAPSAYAGAAALASTFARTTPPVASPPWSPPV